MRYIPNIIFHQSDCSLCVFILPIIVFFPKAEKRYGLLLFYRKYKVYLFVLLNYIANQSVLKRESGMRMFLLR